MNGDSLKTLVLAFDYLDPFELSGFTFCTDVLPNVLSGIAGHLPPGTAAQQSPIICMPSKF